MVQSNSDESAPSVDIERLGKAHVDVLNVLKEEGRANPQRLRDRTPHRKQRINDVLRELEDRYNLIEKLTYALYEFRTSPEKLTCDECGRIFRSPRGVLIHTRASHHDDTDNDQR